MKTLEELIEKLEDVNCEDAIVLVDPDYVTAAIGTDEDGRVVYDYDEMIEYLIKHRNIDEEEAADFLNAGTLKDMSYMGAKRPVVVTKFYD